MEDQYGKKDMIPQKGWEDQFEAEKGDDDEFESVDDSDGYTEKRKKRKVEKPRTRRSNEL